ncbi:hypothetical protein IQ241_14715 [Romeria aff. gracilis LEGE 07310]|uniref:Uncharacterized protein n=1 Tax=Vasconcelosia minhoensis LEGE 07310 TaxID=915328 RepID=A0A8J7DC48_9CYAN|nr:hypothetical protein [Romeria gracilis]MBE9078532.1 hypothetical protein [Romeria aff. gracilis LEGE 07310]
MQNPAVSTSMLLENYSFELSGKEPEQVANNWLSLYPSKWVMAAVVEAIYQGRYKVNSVNRILEYWGFRGQPNHHFDYTFASIVCRQLLEDAEHEAEQDKASQLEAAESMAPVSMAVPMGTSAAAPPGSTQLQALYPPQPSNMGQNHPNIDIQKWVRLPVRLSAHY